MLSERKSEQEEQGDGGIAAASVPKLTEGNDTSPPPLVTPPSSSGTEPDANSDKAEGTQAARTLSAQEAKLMGVFKSFDGDGNGRLSVAEFSKMMSQLGSEMDVDTARNIILRDTELEVSFEGFCDIVKAAG